LLHGIEKILEFLKPEHFPPLAAELFEKLSLCIQSNHFLIAERALQFWQNDYFVSLSRQYSKLIIKTFLPILMQSKHWNPSVNKLCATVLILLEKTDPETFAEVSKKFWLAQIPPQKDVRATTPKSFLTILVQRSQF
jgi:serine/threonine-protein phosphatase 2A regulatory subunit B'